MTHEKSDKGDYDDGLALDALKKLVEE